MVYVDTNVLIYISINQGSEKQDNSAKLVRDLLEHKELFLSPLTIQEFIFTLVKLDINLDQITQDVDFYMDYIQQSIDKSTIKEAYSLCKRINFCKNINDAIHLKIAEKYCRKFITYDKDYKKFRNLTNIEIEILK